MAYRSQYDGKCLWFFTVVYVVEPFEESSKRCPDYSMTDFHWDACPPRCLEGHFQNVSKGWIDRNTILLADLLWQSHLDEHQFYSPEDSGTKNGGTEPYKVRLFWGWGFPLHISRIHTAYIGEHLQSSFTVGSPWPHMKCSLALFFFFWLLL